MSELQPKKHITEIEILRVIACIAVIVIHVTATPVVALRPGSFQQIFFIIINRMAKPSVPLFIFISGFLAYVPERSFQLNSYTKRLQRLFVPYALWTGFYWLIFIKLAGYPMTFSFYLEHLIKGDMMYHLYFMVIILQLALLSPLLVAIAKKVGPTFVFLIALGLQFGFIFVHMPFSDRLFPTYIAYYILGFWVRSQREHLKRTSIAALLYGAIYTLSYILAVNEGLLMPHWFSALFYMLFSMQACLALYVLARQMAFTKPLAQIASASETIYYAHPIALLLGSSVMQWLGWTSIIGESLLSSLLVLALIVPFSLMVHRIKRTRHLRHKAS